jgi:SAM-dependent methyltransferase
MIALVLAGLSAKCLDAVNVRRASTLQGVHFFWNLKRTPQASVVDDELKEPECMVGRLGALRQDKFFKVAIDRHGQFFTVWLRQKQSDMSKCVSLASSHRHHCAHPSLGRRAFDLGCGNGATANLLFECYEVTGIDISESGIALARQRFPHLKLHIRNVYEDLADIYVNSLWS